MSALPAITHKHKRSGFIFRVATNDVKFRKALLKRKLFIYRLQNIIGILFK